MSQLHFSVDDQTARRLAEEAERQGLSLSRYLARLIAEQVPAEWPSDYLQQVVGCLEEPLQEPEDLPVDDVNL